MDNITSLDYKSVPLEDEKQWKTELEKEGFTVIRAVAGEEEVERARALVWEWLESLGTDIRREETSEDIRREETSGGRRPSPGLTLPGPTGPA